MSNNKEPTEIYLTEQDLEDLYQPKLPEELPETQDIISNIELIIDDINTKEMKKLKKENKKKFRKHIISKYKELVSESIIEMIVDGQNMDMLWSMLDKIDRVKTGELSFDDMDKQIKDELHNKYVFPMLRK